MCKTLGNDAKATDLNTHTDTDTLAQHNYYALHV